ncbi:4'-phosphopantetheinyl transferase superfamily protein [Streptomyces sp. NBC_00683]|uniref:4'-phosphopantetheinyl transferase family protein n=1 Tax=Streptomyces sp. NBC_00683 TaxID=2903670 RepID=UPI002E341210|nr:4'-phosphopantetheinyl transferase superfamily protein [Streptomyces sp. NBC_00683]
MRKGPAVTAATVAVADTREVLAMPGAGPSVLTPAEALRLAAARTDGARADFVAARFLARLCAADRNGGSPRDVVLEQRCPDCGGRHGRPRVVGGPGTAPEVSLSYADGVVAAAAADRPVGVDVERLHRDRAPGLRTLRRFLTAGEADRIRRSRTPREALLRTWVRKEAVVKATGAGLPGMALLDLSHLPPGPAGPDRPHRAGVRAPRGSRGSYDLYDLYDLADVPSGVIAAVAVAVAAPGSTAAPRSPAASGPRSLRSLDLDLEETIDTPSYQGDTS